MENGAECVVVGAANTGKTTLIRAITCGRMASVHVIDPGSRARFELRMQESQAVGSVARCDCALLTYSTVERSSFEALRSTQAHRPKCAVILVGSKSDLRDERAVGDEEAEELAERLQCVHVCVSGTQFTNIELLVTLIRMRTLEHFKFAVLNDASSESGSEGEDNEAVLSVQVRVAEGKTVTVGVFEGDCGEDVAKRALRGLHVSQQGVAELAREVQESISAYCRSITRKPLYRVKLNCGAYTDSVLVHAGDDLCCLAASFSQSHHLPPALASQIEPLLRRSHQEYSKQRLALSHQATCVSLSQ